METKKRSTIKTASQANHLGRGGGAEGDDFSRISAFQRNIGPFCSWSGVLMFHCEASVSCSGSVRNTGGKWHFPFVFVGKP